MKFGSMVKWMDDVVENMLLTYDWPGNLKELELLLDEITSMLTTEETIGVDLLPYHFKLKTEKAGTVKPEDFIVHSNKGMLPLEEYLFEAEIYYLQKAMDLHNGNVTKAAAALGMSRQNLQYRLRKIKKMKHRRDVCASFFGFSSSRA